MSPGRGKRVQIQLFAWSIIDIAWSEHAHGLLKVRYTMDDHGRNRFKKRNGQSKVKPSKRSGCAYGYWMGAMAGKGI